MHEILGRFCESPMRLGGTWRIHVEPEIVSDTYRSFSPSVSYLRSDSVACVYNEVEERKLFKLENGTKVCRTKVSDLCPIVSSLV